MRCGSGEKNGRERKGNWGVANENGECETGEIDER